MTIMANGYPSITTDEDLRAEVGSLKAQLAEANTVLNSERTRAEMAEHKALMYHNDLTRVNEIMNSAADRSEWCPVYEEYVDLANQLMQSGFQFVKRDQKYDVSVTITATFNMSITVEAASAEDAQDKVEAMSYEQVYSEAGLSSVIYRESTSDDVEVTGVDRDY